MTRQKKEILKKIEDAELFVAIDSELGRGIVPPGAYDSVYEKICDWREELATLMHFDSVDEMMYNARFYCY